MNAADRFRHTQGLDYDPQDPRPLIAGTNRILAALAVLVALSILCWAVR